jgi:hypothetical protein
MLGVPTMPAQVQTSPGLYGAAQNSIQSGTQNALGNLNSALNANNQAYGGLQNQAQQQYQQNAGAVQQHLAQSGLGNTTVAGTMAQAPMQTLNNSLLNIGGQQQAADANLYSQMAGINQAGGNSLANAQMGTQNFMSNQGNTAQQQGNAMNALNATQSNNQMSQFMNPMMSNPVAAPQAPQQTYYAGPGVATDPNQLALQQLSQAQAAQSVPATDASFYGGQS